jgi:hypothetical protein
MNNWCKTKAELYDFIAFVVLYGPDNFPARRKLTMTSAFEEIMGGLDRCAHEFKSQDLLLAARQLAMQAKAAYDSGEANKGAHLLQDLAAIL